MVGGLAGLHDKLGPAMFAITAPPGAHEGDPWFVVTMSVLGLVGFVVQPHVMTATGSGKTETEARVGMVYGNFIKRVLTIAWAFTGLIALAAFPAGDRGARSQRPAGAPGQRDLVRPGHPALPGRRLARADDRLPDRRRHQRRDVHGRRLGPLHAEFLRPRGPEPIRHALSLGRAAGRGRPAALGILLAVRAESVTQLVLGSVKLIGLLGAAFWLGVVWRRATAAAVWASFLGSLLVWAVMSAEPPSSAIPVRRSGRATRSSSAAGSLGAARVERAGADHRSCSRVEFGLMILVSLVTRPRDLSALGPFYARLHTPVGKEDEVRWDEPPHDLPESATLGMEGIVLDYRKSSRFAYRRLQKLGLEIPRLTWFDWGGFLAAWVLVGGLIGLLIWLAGLGSR